MAYYGEDGNQMTAMNPKFAGEAPSSFPQAYANANGGGNGDGEVNSNARLGKIVTMVLAGASVGLLLVTLLHPAFFTYSIFGVDANYGLLFAQASSGNQTQFSAEFLPTKQNNGKFVDDKMFVSFLFVWIALGISSLYMLTSVIVLCKANQIKPLRFDVPLLFFATASVAVAIALSQLSDTKLALDKISTYKIGIAQMTLFASVGTLGLSFIVALVVLFQFQNTF